MGDICMTAADCGIIVSETRVYPYCLCTGSLEPILFGGIPCSAWVYCGGPLSYLKAMSQTLLTSHRKLHPLQGVDGGRTEVGGSRLGSGK